MMAVPDPTPIMRFIHVGNLHIYLRREGIHAPNFDPDNGMIYKIIHNVDIQLQRRISRIPCGPGGVIHDYVSFYFGPRSPMLYQLHTGWVEGYREGQKPLIYLVSTAQAIRSRGARFVFSDGHGIARFTDWYDNLAHLDKVDWEAVYTRTWKDTVDDMDRQRRKQAEFLVYEFCSWSLIHEIAVIDEHMKSRVEDILELFPRRTDTRIAVRKDWYY